MKLSSGHQAGMPYRMFIQGEERRERVVFIQRERDMLVLGAGVGALL